MNRKLQQRIIVFSGLAIIALLIAIFTNLQFQSISSQNFSDSYQKIVMQARQLTQSFQSEIGKWQSKHYDNATMIKIINNYLPRFQNLINSAKSLPSTPKFENAKDSYTKSVEAEMLSYIYFRNYLMSDNQTTYKRSIQLLSDSLNNETKSFNEFKNVT